MLSYRFNTTIGKKGAMCGEVRGDQGLPLVRMHASLVAGEEPNICLTSLPRRTASVGLRD